MIRKPFPNIINKDISILKNFPDTQFSLVCVESNDFLNNTIIDYDIDYDKDIITVKFAKNYNTYPLLDEKIAAIINLGFVTGKNSINAKLMEERKIGATDLGIAVDNKENILYLYGDSFSGNDVNIGIWNSNFIAKSSSREFNKNIKFDDIIHYPSMLAKPIIQGGHFKNDPDNILEKNNLEVTKIPTGGIRINDYVYIYIMSVSYWGLPGQWVIENNTIYKSKYNDLRNFEECEKGKFFKKTLQNCLQIFPFETEGDEKYVYFISVGGGRFTNLALGRVEKKYIENSQKYEIFTKEKVYKNILKTEEKDYFYLVNKNKSSEPSIMYNKYLKKWIISTLENGSIVFYLSEKLEEEFKERIEVLNFKDFPTLYGGFSNNSLVEDNGKTIYFQVSQWSPIYNTSLFKVIFK